MEFKDIFSKNIMNTELHYITQQSTYTSNIHMNVNDFKIMFDKKRRLINLIYCFQRYIRISFKHLHE